MSGYGVMASLLVTVVAGVVGLYGVGRLVQITRTPLPATPYRSGVPPREPSTWK